MIGYADDQKVKRNLVVMPANSWATSHIAFFQTSGTSNAGYTIYGGTWLPTTGCLTHSMHEFGVGHIVKLGPINKIHTPSNVMASCVTAWIMHLLSNPEHAQLKVLLENTLANTQATIQSMDGPTLNALIPIVQGFYHLWKLTEGYFLTWEQLQVSAQLSETGFWNTYSHWREFVLSHDWIEHAFVQKDTPLPRIHLSVPSTYVDYLEVNRFLQDHDAFLEPTQPVTEYTEKNTPEWLKMKKHFNAIQLYIENRALLLGIVVRGQRIFV